MQTPERPERLRSPFAAAFFSSIQPGFGQFYAGSWLRGLFWAAPSILFYAFILGVIRSMGLFDFAAQFSSPSFLQGVLVFLVISLIYRGAAAIDAYRVASRPGHRGAAAATVSGAGLLAVLMVMLLAHAALGQTVYGVINVLNGFSQPDQTDNPNETFALPSGFASELPQSLPPSSSGGGLSGPTESVGPTPSQGEWDGNQRLNILLVGSDAGRYNVNEYLTDTLMVASIDPQTGRMALISLPRDTVGVPFPSNWPAYRAYNGKYGCAACKINTLYTIARGSPSLFPDGNAQTRGFDALKGALGTLYGLDIKYYVAVDLTGFRDIINTLGGVMVDVQVPIYDAKYPANEGQGSTKLYIPPGIQFMDGSEALAYARARHTTSDFDRAARQQRVLASVREQTDLSTLLAPGVLTQLFNELKSDIKTDIPPDLFPKLVGLAQQVDFNNRTSLVLTPPTYSTTCYFPSGHSTNPNCPNTNLYLLEANVPAIRNAVKNVFTESKAQQARQEAIQSEAAVVSVLNGTAENNTVTTRVAESLATYGINATVPPVNSGFADRRDYPTTVITAWNGADEDMSTTISVLEKLFGVQAVTGTDPNQTADITVIVGANTQTPPQANN